MQEILIHPESGIPYSMQEAAELIGIHVTTLYNRKRFGDTGTRLWRPGVKRGSRQAQESLLPSNEIKLSQITDLHKIPRSTKFDNL